MNMIVSTCVSYCEMNCCYGAGTNEAAIIEVLTTHDAKQRFAIRERYQSLCGKVRLNNVESRLTAISRLTAHTKTL